MYVLIIEADAFSCAGRQRGAVQQAGRQLIDMAHKQSWARLPQLSRQCEPALYG